MRAAENQIFLLQKEREREREREPTAEKKLPSRGFHRLTGRLSIARLDLHVDYTFIYIKDYH